MPLFAAKLSVHFLRIDDVISMFAALRCLEIGRAIQMRDSERFQVVGYGGGIINYGAISLSNCTLAGNTAGVIRATDPPKTVV